MAPLFTEAPGHPDQMSGRTLTSLVRTSVTTSSALASAGSMPTPSRVPPLTDDERAALMVEVRRAGETAASRRLGIPRPTMARALARLKIQAGSVLLIRHGLASTRPSADNTVPPPEAA